MANKSPGTLYIVGLPIGNPADLTFRAVDIFKNVDIVACEDTREFKQLLAALKIETNARMLAYHEHNETQSAPELIKFLLAGKSIALVSDAGTPGISDPGHNILKLAYEADVPVTVIPGASSVTSSLSVSPVGGKTFVFLGFLPSKNPIKFLSDYVGAADRIVFFEAPHRILETLKSILETFGDVQFSFHRELTKHFEESKFLKISDAISQIQKNVPKGEFVIILPRLDHPGLSKEKLVEKIHSLLKQDMKDSDIAAQMAKESNFSRKEIYKIIQDIKSS